MATPGTSDGPRRKFLARVKAASLPSKLAVVVGAASLVSVTVTYLIQAGWLPVVLTQNKLIALIGVNSALALALAALMVWRLLRLRAEQRSGIAGAKLHVRLVTMFSLVAVVPIVLVAIFAAISLNLGVQAWFATRVKAALGNAVNVAEHYEQDHEKLIIGDALSVANRIERDGQIVVKGKTDEPRLFSVLHDISQERGLAAAYILHSNGQIVGAIAPNNFNMSMPNPLDFEQAGKGTIVIGANSKLGLVRALIALPEFKDSYLLVVRPIDKVVLGYYQNTVSAIGEYNSLAEHMAFVQFILAALYVLVALLILLVAVWMGIWAAEELVDPISRLIEAAERVARGDLKAQVAAERGDDELGRLAKAFNRMTSQLDAQRNELVEKNRQIDARRRFTEAVLAGVSAGVVGLDADGQITLVNRAAARLLNASPDETEGRHYAEAVPELAALIRKAVQEPAGRASGEAQVKRTGATQTLSVQVDSDTGGGFVVTFDDITDLVSAQRTAAWADVARRIAHEIKNPLTPIQLSAERLKRKYAKEVHTDPEIFTQCTDTIIRQVGDIGRMVDEFSSFARMPAPVMAPNIFQELLQQSVFLQRVAHPQIDFTITAPKDPLRIICDGRLIAQVMTNILKNACEAIAARHDRGEGIPGRIELRLFVQDDRAVLSVSDNGIGLPAELRNRLTEPYVTTRAKGTGLGLAIVRKIAEDHGGDLALNDRDDEGQGACVRLTLPLVQRQDNVTELEGGYEQERIADRA